MPEKGGLEKMMELKKRRNAYLMFLLLCLVAAAAIAGMSALLYQSSTSEQGVAWENENAGEDDGDAEFAEGENGATEDGGNGSDGAAKTADGSGTDDADTLADGAAEAADGALAAEDENSGSENSGRSQTADASEAADNGGDRIDTDGAGGGNASNMADGTDGEDSLAAAGQVTESLLAEKIAVYSFAAGKITWPVEGEVCLEYNMEHTVYYSTLDLYRCNPGVCISAAVGTAVTAGADGVVTSVTQDDFYGTMVTVALGDDYVATYGQLADVCVSVGDEVSASTQIGTVAEPTIYFTEEGAHLFFEVTKDGETLDPLDYLNY